MKSALILALNPSIDAEWAVERVLEEEKNVVASERRWAGGKGINVARWLQHLGGGGSRLLLPLGGQPGLELARCLRLESLPAKVVRLQAPTRVNVIVTPKRGPQLRFNPVGPLLARSEWEQVRRETRQLLVAAPALVLSGSLPRGVPADAYARLIRLARQAGVPAILDCDGAPFARAVEARPFLVKPNAHELAQWWGRPLRSEAAVRRAADELSRATGGWVLVSRGAEPTLLVNAVENVRFTAKPPPVRVINTVGAGDALLAGAAWQIGQRARPADWLCWGVACGTAAASCVAGHLPSTKRIREIWERVSGPEA